MIEAIFILSLPHNVGSEVWILFLDSFGSFDIIFEPFVGTDITEIAHIVLAIVEIRLIVVYLDVAIFMIDDFLLR